MDWYKLITYQVLLIYRAHTVYATSSNHYGQRFLVAVPYVTSDNNNNNNSQANSSRITFVLHSLTASTFTVDVYGGRLCGSTSVLVGRGELSVYNVQDCTSSRSGDSALPMAPFMLTSQHLFSVTVWADYVTSSPTETMLAVPVNGWGHVYYAVTLRYMPTLQIITDLENVVKITLRLMRDENVTYVVHENKNYKTDDVIIIKLPKCSTFEFIRCDQNRKNPGELTGTRIEGEKPIGVVTGNCQGGTSNKKCVSRESEAKADVIMKNVVAEYLLPFESFGKEFISFQSFLADDELYLVVVAGENETVVRVSDRDRHKISLRRQGDSADVTNTTTPLTINSTKPVQVMVVKRSPCVDGLPATGHTTLSLLIPNVLFLDMYHWTAPEFDPGYFMSHYAILVIPTDSVSYFVLDGVQLTNISLDLVTVKGGSTWSVAHVKLSHQERRAHDVITRVKRVRFGCYLYGVSNNGSYMQPAGFISTDLRSQKSCVKKVGTVLISDFIDNDCDGKVDEEDKNGVDDDNDGLTDEDLGNPVAVDGQWGRWSDWTCVSCNSTNKIKSRVCNNPYPVYGGRYCPGEDFETVIGECMYTCRDAPQVARNERNILDVLWTLSRSILSRDKRQGNNTLNQTVMINATTAAVWSNGTRSAVLLNTTTVGVTTTRATTAGVRRPTAAPMASTGTTAAWESQAYWGEWAAWLCLEDCGQARSNGTAFRKRDCLDKKVLKQSEMCQGERYQEIPANCLSRCANSCPPFKWRADCQGDCGNCEEDCNKLNGSCVRCKPGFQNPKMSCSDVCDPFHYGYMCQELCLVKCDGVDCLDKVTGKCPDTKSNMWLMLFLLIFPPVFLLLFLRYKHIKAGREDPLAFIVESPSNLGITASRPSLYASRSKASMGRSATSLRKSGVQSSTSMKSQRSKRAISEGGIDVVEVVEVEE